jgi:hypothetical protein
MSKIISLLLLALASIDGAKDLGKIPLIISSLLLWQ